MSVLVAVCASVADGWLLCESPGDCPVSDLELCLVDYGYHQKY